MNRLRLLCVTLCALSFQLPALQASELLRSPDGKIRVELTVDEGKAPSYRVSLGSALVLADSKLGLTREDSDFSCGLSAAGKPVSVTVSDNYELKTGKRLRHHYEANRFTLPLKNAAGRRMDIVFQISNDGVAFRYVFPDGAGETHRILDEHSSFKFPSEAQSWLQPMAAPKTGFARTNPSYEEHYAQGLPVGKASPHGFGWVFPALFRSGDVWVALTEAGLRRDTCASRLRHEAPKGEYRIGFPDTRETMDAQDVRPLARLPWTGPWRIITLGSLGTLVESTLGTDLADPAVPAAKEAPAPGKSSWSWALMGDAATTYEVQKRFVDYAHDMGWAYCLIDAQWDTQIGYERMQELADYAKSQNVKLLLWYNSNGDANDAPQTPLNMLVKRELRLKEFERLKGMGIAGLKVDFFGGDGRAVINYYLDLLEDSAAYGFAMNFHGSTYPRGWHRTYPHLMTMEAIKGFEFLTFTQADADQEPNHAAMLPFTRNLFDPMDFTPVCLDKIGNTQRRTTTSFELALSVLFISGVQHYVETPEGMAKMPKFVQDFMRQVPSVWEETRFIDGFPGKFVVIARRAGDTWYLAGINGEAVEKVLSLDLSVLKVCESLSLIEDSGGPIPTQRELKLDQSNGLKLKLLPNGGFVAVLKAR